MKYAGSVLFENIKVALASIRSHLLRTTLTVLIISIGIMALVGILTAIDSIEASIPDNFMRLGANSFSIRNRQMLIQTGGQNNRPEVFRYISYDEALRFKESFDFPSFVSVSVMAAGAVVVRSATEETNPNVSVTGSDDNFLIASGNDLAEGRNFSANELENGENVIILGHRVAETLFPTHQSPLGQSVSIGTGSYRVIGVLSERGAGLGFGDDLRCVIPLRTARSNFARPQMNYTISVSSRTITDMESAMGEATGLFRVIRGVRSGEENNFDVARSDNIAQALIENLRYVTIAATLIGLITLLGAGIGLMNIMLVSVTERTQEIGIRKALGATNTIIKQQFLAEAIVICQIGGLLGIVLGVAAGNLISMLIQNPFVVPWLWVLGGVALCALVGLIAGYYPAARASKLDPIESLRYE